MLRNEGLAVQIAELEAVFDRTEKVVFQAQFIAPLFLGHVIEHSRAPQGEISHHVLACHHDSQGQLIERKQAVQGVCRTVDERNTVKPWPEHVQDVGGIGSPLDLILAQDLALAAPQAGVGKAGAFTGGWVEGLQGKPVRIHILSLAIDRDEPVLPAAILHRTPQLGKATEFGNLPAGGVVEVGTVFSIIDGSEEQVAVLHPGHRLQIGCVHQGRQLQGCQVQFIDAVVMSEPSRGHKDPAPALVDGADQTVEVAQGLFAFGGGIQLEQDAFLVGGVILGDQYLPVIQLAEGTRGAGIEFAASSPFQFLFPDLGDHAQAVHVVVGIPAFKLRPAVVELVPVDLVTGGEIRTLLHQDFLPGLASGVGNADQAVAGKAAAGAGLANAVVCVVKVPRVILQVVGASSPAGDVLPRQGFGALLHLRFPIRPQCGCRLAIHLFVSGVQREAGIDGVQIGLQRGARFAVELGKPAFAVFVRQILVEAGTVNIVVCQRIAIAVIAGLAGGGQFAFPCQRVDHRGVGARVQPAAILR